MTLHIHYNKHIKLLFYNGGATHSVTAHQLTKCSSTDTAFNGDESVNLENFSSITPEDSQYHCVPP